MEGFLDLYAQISTYRSVSTRLKLLLGLGSILLSVTAINALVPLTIGIILAIVIVRGNHTPAKVYLTLLVAPLIFTAISSVVIVVMQTGGAVLFSFQVLSFDISITEGGIYQSVLVFSRVFGSSSALFFIALTTPVIEVFSVLRQIGFPQVVIDLAMLMYRAIFILIEDASTIYRAQLMRCGYQSMRRGLITFAMMAGSLFIRAMDDGEQLLKAMDARCYDGKYAQLSGDSECSIKQAVIVSLFLFGLGSFSFLLSIKTLTGA